MLQLKLATPPDLEWAQLQVTNHHYLRARVDPRCSPMAYVVDSDIGLVGCLIFGRPESTRCYDQGSRLTYGSWEDVQAGRCLYDRWELLNLARVWLDPRIQRGGADYVPRAASQLILEALGRVGYDYLAQRPPVDCRRPYQLRVCLSYCDTRLHTGYLYRVCRFKLARTNAAGIQTFIKPLAPLTADQDDRVRRLAEHHPRSRRLRLSRLPAATQESFVF